MVVSEDWEEGVYQTWYNMKRNHHTVIICIQPSIWWKHQPINKITWIIIFRSIIVIFVFEIWFLLLKSWYLPKLPCFLSRINLFELIWCDAPTAHVLYGNNFVWILLKSYFLPFLAHFVSWIDIWHKVDFKWWLAVAFRFWLSRIRLNLLQFFFRIFIRVIQKGILRWKLIFFCYVHTVVVFQVVITNAR